MGNGRTQRLRQGLERKGKVDVGDGLGEEEVNYVEAVEQPQDGVDARDARPCALANALQHVRYLSKVCLGEALTLPER